MALPKTKQKALLRKVKAVLTARRNRNMDREREAQAALFDYCVSHNICPDAAMGQGIEWLKKNDIAASMNGLV